MGSMDIETKRVRPMKERGLMERRRTRRIVSIRIDWTAPRMPIARSMEIARGSVGERIVCIWVCND